MNTTLNQNSFPIYPNTQLADRWLSIYSLILIIIGTPSNLLCCIIYFQKANRSNSIKTIFGYLALLDTIVLYTFNLNYVFREFNFDYQFIYYQEKNRTNFDYNNVNINIIIIKKNLEEYSLFICRFLSYLGKKKTKSNISNELITLVNPWEKSITFFFFSSFFNPTNIILDLSIWFIESLFINIEIISI